jgi:hypothetical protein
MISPPEIRSTPDAIKFLREEIRYENQQIAARVNYLSAVQSFLFVAFAISNGPGNRLVVFGNRAIPLLGMLTAILAWTGIVAAWIQLTSYRRQLSRAYEQLNEDWPRVGATEWVNWIAMLYPLLVPVVFFGAWLVALALVWLGHLGG